MIYRLYPDSDTVITNYVRRGVRMTGSNVGACETLQLFSMPFSYLSSSVSRILIHFDVSQLPAAAASSGSFRLRLFNAQSERSFYQQFPYELLLISGSWDEGYGLDTDEFLDSGYANWERRTADEQWSAPGGDVSALIASGTTDGSSDLTLDITSAVRSWLSGSTNDGMMLRISGSYESGSSTSFGSVFHGRSTHFLDKTPYIEAYWDSSVGSVTGNLQADPAGPWVVNVRNIKNEYDTRESARMRLYVRPLDYNPAVVSTASYDRNGCVMTDAYYRIINDRTGQQVIPFGTSSGETKLSYDASGNFFDVQLAALAPLRVYRLSFMFFVSGSSELVDSSFKFKVV